MMRQNDILVYQLQLYVWVNGMKIATYLVNIFYYHYFTSFLESEKQKTINWEALIVKTSSLLQSQEIFGGRCVNKEFNSKVQYTLDGF